MKKLIVAVLVIVAAWLVVSLTGSSTNKTAAGRDWPLGLGPLESVPERYPVTVKNEAARKLERLAATDDAAALRALLLSGRPLVWDSDIRRGTRAPMPDVRMSMRVSRLLTKSARETKSWDDLRAQWELAKPLWRRPELISAVVAMGITRNIVDAADEMNAPAPAWLDELRTFPFRKAMITVMQADAWSSSLMIKEYAARSRDGNVLRQAEDAILAPYYRLSRGDYVAKQRRAAAALAKGEPYRYDVAWWNRPVEMMMPNTTLVWERLAQLETDVKKVTR